LKGGRCRRSRRWSLSEAFLIEHLEFFLDGLMGISYDAAERLVPG